MFPSAGPDGPRPHRTHPDRPNIVAPKPIPVSAEPEETGRSWLWSRIALLAPFLAVLPLAAYGFLLLLGLRAERAADRREDLQRTTAALAIGIEAELRAGLRSLDALSVSEHLRVGDLAGFRREAQRLLGREPSWFTIALTDGERQILNLRYPAEASLPPLADLAAVASVLRSGRAAPGSIADGRVALRVPVRLDGVVRYVLLATQEATSFAAPLDRAALPPGWSALLLDREGRLLARAATGAAQPESMRLAVERLRETVEAEGVLAQAVPIGEGRWTLVVGAPPPGFARNALGWLIAAIGLSAVFAAIGVAARSAMRHSSQEASRQRRHADVLARAAELERRRSELLATLSQDLRAPLDTLLGHTDRLAKADLPPAARAWVDQQRRAGEALQAMVVDALDFARLEEGALELEDTDIEIAPLLDDCAGRMRGEAVQKGLTLRVAIDPGLPRWIRGDPQRLRQITLNLIGNAIKFTSQGEIVIGARLTARPEQVEVSVTDTGIGISAEELPRLFDRFREGGSGLGLAISRRLAEAMHGSIGVDSKPGRGSRFHFAIPFRPGAAPAAPKRAGALRILVAEDVPASRLLLKAVLERAGHVVFAAEDGAAALAALHGASYDLVLLDLHMEGLDGLGVAGAVRGLPGEQGRVPMIALTADTAEQVEASCHAAGFDAVLRKPFETRRLLGLIDGLRSRDGTGSSSPARTAVPAGE